MSIQFFTDFTNRFALDDGKTLIGPIIVISAIVLMSIFATLCAIRLGVQYSAAKKLLIRMANESVIINHEDVHFTRFAESKTTKGNLARAALDLGTCKSPAEVRELVSQLAVREESRRSAAFLSFAVGSVLILGLMGTFIAFAELVSSSDLSGDAFQQGIKNVLEHLNLAFYASIAGVGASIWLLLCSTVWIKPKRQLLLADSEDCLVKLYHDSVRVGLIAMEGTESGDLFETLRKLSGNLSLAVESISSVATRFEQFSLSTPEAIAETLVAVKTQIAESSLSYAELVTTATATKDAVQGISSEATKVLGEMLKEHGGRQLEVYAQAQEFSRKLLEDITRKDEERLTAYRQGINDIAEKVADLAVGWELRSKDLVTAFQTERTDYIAHLKEAGDLSAATFENASKNSFDAIEKIAANMTFSCSKVATEAVEQLKDAYHTQISDWTQSAEIAKLQNKTLKETLGILDKRLAPLSNSLDKLYEETGKTLTEAANAVVLIAKVPEQLDSIIASHTGGINVLNAEAKRMADTVRDLKTDATGVFEKTGNNLTRLSSQLETIIEIGKRGGYDKSIPTNYKFGKWAKRLFSRNRIP